MTALWTLWRIWETSLRPSDPNEAWKITRLCAASGCLPLSTVEGVAHAAVAKREALGRRLTEINREGEALIAQMNRIDDALDEVGGVKP